MAGAALGLWSSSEGVKRLGATLRLATAWGEGVSVVLLNPHAPASPLTEAMREAARAEVESLRAEGISPPLRCHDLFLAEALGLDPFPAYGGCAAATTLAHLDGEGNLRACRTLPEPLGNLLAAPLAELWARPERKALAARLALPPLDCEGCSLGAQCRGGCPGLALEEGARDGSCPGPR